MGRNDDFLTKAQFDAMYADPKPKPRKWSSYFLSVVGGVLTLLVVVAVCLAPALGLAYLATSLWGEVAGKVTLGASLLVALVLILATVEWRLDRTYR